MERINLHHIGYPEYYELNSLGYFMFRSPATAQNDSVYINFVNPNTDWDYLVISRYGTV